MPGQVQQQASNRIRPWISDETTESVGSNLDAGMIAANEDRLAGRCRDQSDRRTAVQRQQPRLPIGGECPARVGRQIDPLQHEMAAGGEQRSLGGKTPRTALNPSRSRIGHCHGIVFMQFALPALIEQTECGVAALLNFGKHDARADGVDGARGHQDNVTFDDRPPLNEIGDRAVPDRRPQLL